MRGDSPPPMVRGTTGGQDMTPEQKEDEKQRALERIKGMREAFNKSKLDASKQTK